MAEHQERQIITVSHLDGELIFSYPAKGPDTYENVGEQIDNDKIPSQLHKPTTAETISLIYSDLQDKDNKYALEILYNTWKSGFWCFTKNLWIPEGVFVVNDKDGSELNRKDLEKRLEANDEDVRFVPKGFKLGEQTTEELENNNYIKAHVGEEGIQKLAEIAGKFRAKPLVYGLEEITLDIETRTGLAIGWDEKFYKDWLGFVGNIISSRNYYAFGILRRE